ncbi:MAG: crossover junction endodeoxyribonuclease RuvC [Candidatus Komeilibacteria bacterium RIFCSPLOWO2_02_FULL_48_11]|uniref:Crossover junction endodeoxyribonuclease RuvC n=1 Tax=Candidatus Komeilibacteria bacterium RIFCSPLOWO2_02_FULL_48_11 TaxID=1798553 RepID=A0A1G2BRZ3_9BACT|nr:MAG: crossover junction endodeoxyribonuclease RuvC [Candidatus Komeilibacteria bacterium RIFCSPLOWO2_02_FULL_48_11]
MIILGIDPGIADTGYGVITKHGDDYAVIAYGSIKTPAKDGLPARLQRLHRELRMLIKKHSPDIVAVEELFFSKNVKTAITVSHARGVILLTAREAGCLVREFTPLQVKQALVGYGRADKNQIQQMVKTILGLKEIPKPDDAADALAVAICCGQTKIFKL